MIEFRELTAEEGAIVEGGVDDFPTCQFCKAVTVPGTNSDEHAHAFRGDGGGLKWICGLCKREWQPGHTCLTPRPMTAGEVALLAAQMKDVLAEFRRVQALAEQVLAPENWD